MGRIDKVQASIKQQSVKTIEALPESVEMEEIMYHLYVLDKITKGQQAVKQGKTHTILDLKQDIKQW